MRFFWFLLLKVVEVGGVVFGPLYLGKLVHCWTEFFCYVDSVAGEIDHAHDWAIGGGTLVFVLAGVAVIAGNILFVIGNWELAGKIRDRF